ncbi:glyoxalase [Caldovatus sediminis]|uniref:Glyoxalase n=1 Tax=Caldovatus sediminis TaxID=2041189 RepID=A0A8J2ZE26_9PROT|nr:VOC family protein [Caldovatus sediminis]GGG44504.1 glyoxalase [Caldovatus sediminis]
MTEFAFDHIHLRTPDVEATARWYERMFGAKVLRSTQQGQPRVDLELGGQKIFLAPVADGSTADPPSAPYQGLEHFGLRVTGLDAVVAELKAKGAEFTLEPMSPRPGIRIAFLRGPQNVSIELLERGV